MLCMVMETGRLCLIIGGGASINAFLGCQPGKKKKIDKKTK
jgi:hypothetical protein